MRACQALSIAERGLTLEFKLFLSAKTLNPSSFNILAALGIILIQGFMYMRARPSTDVNSLLIPMGGCYLHLPRICRVVFHSGMFLHLPWERLCCYGTRQTFFFPFNSSISWKGEPLYTVHVPIHVPASHLPLELGKASMKPLVSHNRNLLYHRLKLFMGDVYRQFWKTGLGVIFSWCPGVSGEAAAASGKQFLPWRY